MGDITVDGESAFSAALHPICVAVSIWQGSYFGGSFILMNIAS